MKLWKLFLLYLQWNKRRSGAKITDLTRECGYFFPVGMIGYDPIDKPHLIKMQSGKLMRAKLLDFLLYDDPADMVKEAHYQYLGYDNEVPFAEMSWDEYKGAHYGT